MSDYDVSYEAYDEEDEEAFNGPDLYTEGDRDEDYEDYEEEDEEDEERDMQLDAEDALDRLGDDVDADDREALQQELNELVTEQLANQANVHDAFECE